MSASTGHPAHPDYGMVPYDGAYQNSPYNGLAAAGESEGVPWMRYIEALRRHLLLIVVIAAAGSVLGMLAARRVAPVYDVQSTVWIASNNSGQSGPIRPQQLLPATSWVELLRSYAIVDPVVHKLKLNLGYPVAADSVYFRNFETLPNLHPGGFQLKIETGGRYVLSARNGVVVERGVVGDSIGRKIGVAWQPDANLLKPGKTVSFWVSTTRSASNGLLAGLRTSLPDDGQFLTITLSGAEPERTARTLNAWVEQFVLSSGDLKKKNLLEFKKILSEQLGVAETALRTAEIKLEQFRVANITLPSGGPATGVANQLVQDPSVAGYFQQRGTLGDIQSERIGLEQMLTSASGGPINPQAFLMFPSILNDAPQLRAALEELSTRQAALRTEQQFLTDANPRIKQLNATIHDLQYQTIPQIAQNVLQSLRTRERNLTDRLAAQSSELRGIPTRSIEEMRLSRQVSASENLYNVLKARYEEASIAEAQTSPDLSVLDLAAPPMHPNSNDAPRLVFLAIIASLGFATALALLHDRLDRRFRYPEQATKDLGLTIIGTVPRLRSKGGRDFDIDSLSQVVESFRTLRLGLRYNFQNRPVMLTVSSPGIGDGKSLVSANLALAFASAGHRTLLIDGDVRRGALHSTFDVPVTPGLVELLGRVVDLDSVIRSTSSANLFILPRGTRAGRAPELLISDDMNALVNNVSTKFDVIIIDSPPFLAGVDAYALGALTGSMLVVLRQGISDRKLAAAKLSVLDRLPVRILGTVINGVPAGGMYKYYGTDYTRYGTASSVGGSLATPRGLVVNG